MTPAEINTILYRLDKQDEVLGEIQAHVSQTNGKVAVLMADKIARDAVAADRKGRRSWLSPMMIALAAAGLGSFLTALFTLVL